MHDPEAARSKASVFRECVLPCVANWGRKVAQRRSEVAWLCYGGNFLTSACHLLVPENGQNLVYFLINRDTSIRMPTSHRQYRNNGRRGGLEFARTPVCIGGEYEHRQCVSFCFSPAVSSGRGALFLGTPAGMS